MDLELSGKRILVTGSGSGIGKATAEAFLKEGAKLIVHGLTRDEVTACIDELSPLGEVSGLEGDLAKPEDATALCEFALSAGDIDCLLYTSPSPRDRQKSRMPSSA